MPHPNIQSPPPPITITTFIQQRPPARNTANNASPPPSRTGSADATIQRGASSLSPAIGQTVMLMKILTMEGVRREYTKGALACQPLHLQVHQVQLRERGKGTIQWQGGGIRTTKGASKRQTDTNTLLYVHAQKVPIPIKEKNPKKIIQRRDHKRSRQHHTPA